MTALAPGAGVATRCVVEGACDRAVAPLKPTPPASASAGVGIAAPPRATAAVRSCPIRPTSMLTATGGSGADRAGTGIAGSWTSLESRGNAATVTVATTTATTAAPPTQSAKLRLICVLYHSARER